MAMELKIREPEMNYGIMGAFSVRASGNIGQVVLDPDGRIIAWTTDSWVAQVIARLLSENEELFFIVKEK
jgi:hypothetical protein